MSEPLVSALIPVYNGERFVGEAIASVLAQTWSAIECIVVDDGSTDGTPDVVGAFDDERVRYVRQDNGGVAAARNHGMAVARGQYVAFLDADDVWLPRKAERQVRAFEARPELGLVLTGYTIVDEQLRPRITVLPDRSQLDLRRLLMLEASGVGLSFTGMVKASLALELGFDGDYSTAADLEFALRVRQRSPIDVIVEPLALYRTHGEQMHLDLDSFERDTLQLYGAWLGDGSPLAADRRRAVANLYTRIFYYELSRLHGRRARRALAVAVRNRPVQLLWLPAWAVATRARKWWVLRQMGDRAVGGS